MVQIAIVNMAVLGFDHEDEYSLAKIAESISDWDEATEEEIALLESWLASCNVDRRREYRLIKRLDYEGRKQEIFGKVREAIRGAEKEEAERRRRAEEYSARRAASDLKRKQARLEKLKKEIEAANG